MQMSRANEQPLSNGFALSLQAFHLTRTALGMAFHRDLLKLNDFSTEKFQEFP
jgi:hypothetical protein